MQIFVPRVHVSLELLNAKLFVQPNHLNQGEVVCLLHKIQHNDRQVCLLRPSSSGNQRHPLRDKQLDTGLDGRLAAPAGRRLDGLFPGAIAAAAAGRRRGRVVASGGRGGEENLSQSHFGTVPYCFSASDAFHHGLKEQLPRSEHKSTSHSES